MVERNDTIHELQDEFSISNHSFPNPSLTNNQFSGFDSFRQILEDSKADQNSFNENASIKMGSIQISPIEAAEACFTVNKAESKHQNIFFIRSFPNENDDSCIESSLGLLAPKYKNSQEDKTPNFSITREDLPTWENAMELKNKAGNTSNFGPRQNFDLYQFIASGTCEEFDKFNQEKIPDICWPDDLNRITHTEDKKCHKKAIFTINPAKLVKSKSNKRSCSKIIETPTGLKRAKDIFGNKITGFSASNPNFKIRQNPKNRVAFIHRKTPTSVYETVGIQRESRRNSLSSQAIQMNEKKSIIKSVKPIDFRSKQAGFSISLSINRYKSLDKLFGSKQYLNQLNNSNKEIEMGSKKFYESKSRMVIKQN